MTTLCSSYRPTGINGKFWGEDSKYFVSYRPTGRNGKFWGYNNKYFFVFYRSTGMNGKFWTEVNTYFYLKGLQVWMVSFGEKITSILYLTGLHIWMNSKFWKNKCCVAYLQLSGWHVGESYKNCRFLEKICHLQYL